jgi:toxin ParE1/3/4
MRIRWAFAAANDLEPVRKLYDAARSLKQFPNRGRMGRKTGTRELVIAPLPYIIVYRVLDHGVEIARLVHTSQDWARK